MRKISAILAIALGVAIGAGVDYVSDAVGAQAYQGSNVTNATGILAANHGGTGVANNAAATLTRSGSHALTLTTTGTTSLTLPTSGTVTAQGNTVTGSGSIVLATSPTLTGTTNVGGLVASNGFRAGTCGTSPGDASWYCNATTGATLQAKAGSSYDFSIINPGNNVYIARNPTGTQDVELVGGLRRGITTQTGATYSIAAIDTHVIANRAGTVTLTLGTASAGRELTVRTITANTVVSASSNVVPCAGGAAGTAILAATAGKWAMLVGDGTNWQIQACN